jgi:hypothetical protein
MSVAGETGKPTALLAEIVCSIEIGKQTGRPLDVVDELMLISLGIIAREIGRMATATEELLAQLKADLV